MADGTVLGYVRTVLEIESLVNLVSPSTVGQQLCSTPVQGGLAP